MPGATRRRARVVAGASLVLALAACQPPQPAAPSTDAASAVPDAVAHPVVAIHDPVAFAGDFTGTAPCADCPGIDITLSLSPDGAYRLKSVRQGDASHPSLLNEGNWRLDEEGLRIRLVPRNSGESTQWFGVAAADELRLFGSDGKAFDDPSAYRLKRAAH